MKRIGVLLAEDHETVRQGIKLLIDGQPDMAVIAEAADGAAAVERAAAVHPDVAVLDISMPQMNGLEAARRIRDRAPATAVVALTRHTDVAYVQQMLQAGVAGYVLKQSAPSELLEAIRTASRGQPHLDASLAARGQGRTTPRGGAAAATRVTEREAEVLRLMAVGHSNKETAEALEISVRTVEVHKANGMRKLGLRGRIDVVKYAVLQGWLSEP
jgi:DNA-binding NarL/FixJ family response regulator